MLKKAQIFEWLLESQENSAASILEQCVFSCEHVESVPTDSLNSEWVAFYEIRIGAPAKILKLVEVDSADFVTTIEDAIHKIASAVDCDVVSIRWIPRLPDTRNLSDSPEFRGLIHKIAVICKDYYVIRTIDDMFIFAGANRDWWKEPNDPHGSARMSNVFGWIEGIEAHAPDQMQKTIDGVVMQIKENEIVPEGDRKVLGQRVNQSTTISAVRSESLQPIISYPKDIEELLERLIRGLPRSMLPLKDRRKGASIIEFNNEYDVQSLFHAMLRPWIKDIRAEEYTPSYAGSSTRVDFLCPKYRIVLEIKFVRDKHHAKKIGDELIIDIAHYKVHPDCQQLWNVIFDPQGFLSNPDGLIEDLDGFHESRDKKIEVRTFVLGM